MAEAASKRIIAVFGATGLQGGSVVRYLQKHAPNDFAIRALTRNPDSDKAKALAANGVEVVQVDQTGAVQALTDALKGAYGVFSVTNFWDPATGENEEKVGKAVVDAAKAANVQHFIYSGLANANTLSGGKYTVPHFDMKARVIEHARSLGFPYLTNVEPACYAQNFTTILAPRVNDDGSEVLAVAMDANKKLSLIDITKYGGAVAAAFKNPDKYNNADLLLQTDYLTPTEMAAAYTEAKGSPINLYSPEPLSDGFKQVAGEEMSQMFAWFDEFGYYGPQTESRNRDSGLDAIRELETEYAKSQGKDDAAVAEYVEAALKEATFVETIKRALQQ